MDPKVPREYYLAELSIWDLRTLVKDVYENIDASESVYQRFLESLERDGLDVKAIVNLNYDTTFDDVLQGKFYCPGNGKPKENKIPLIRPHGSLKWTSRSNWVIGRGWNAWTESYEDTSLEEIGFRSERDSTSLKFSQPLIVPPASFKEEVVGNSSMPGLQNQILHRQWDEMDRVLRECDSWVFVGISFASGDDHLLWLLKRNNKSCRKLYCSSYGGDNNPLKKKLKKFWGTVSSILN